MRELIETNPDILSAYEAGNDALVIELLNAPSQKVLSSYSDDQPDGFHSNASMGDVLGADALGLFLMTMQGAIATQPATVEGQTQATIIESMVSRFNTTVYGIDFSHEEIRSTLTAIFTIAGLDPQPYLDLGYTYQTLTGGTPATQADIDELRAEDSFVEYADVMGEKVSNASALFNARWQADATLVPPVFWDDATKVDEWSKAWSES